MRQATRHREQHRMGLHTDYEPILFTPTLADDDLDGTGEGQVYSVQIGRARRIGNWIDFALALTTTDLGTLTGANGANVLGLPYPIRTLVDYFATFVLFGSSLNITASENLVGRGVSGTSHIELFVWNQGAGPGILTITELSVGALLNISGTYETDDLTE